MNREDETRPSMLQPEAHSRLSTAGLEGVAATSPPTQKELRDLRIDLSALRLQVRMLRMELASERAKYSQLLFGIEE